MRNVFLSEQNVKQAETFINDYFFYLQEQWEKGLVSFRYYTDTLITVADSYPFLSPAEKWEEMGYYLCGGIKEELETQGVYRNVLGMLGGLGKQAFAVSLYSKQTGNLNSFSNTLNKLLLDKATEKAESLSQSENTFATDYDAIGGIAGILNYLLDFEWNKEAKEKLEKMARYLVSLTHCHNYQGNEIMNFHIPKDNLFLDVEKEKYPNGNYNFGLSHGMVGPLIALCKAMSKGIKTEDMQSAIDNIFNIYETFYDIHQGVIFWPTYLSLENYLKGSCTVKLTESRASWCYGNVGMARGLQLAAKYRQDEPRVKKYGEYLADMMDQPVENFRLSNPCLCHGYASVMAVAMAADMDQPDPRLTRSMNRLFTEALLVMSGTKETPYWNGSHFDMDLIIKDYFEDDTSFLQGPGGLVLALLNVMHPGLKFGRLLMIK